MNPTVGFEGFASVLKEVSMPEKVNEWCSRRAGGLVFWGGVVLFWGWLHPALFAQIMTSLIVAGGTGFLGYHLVKSYPSVFKGLAGMLLSITVLTYAMVYGGFEVLFRWSKELGKAYGLGIVIGWVVTVEVLGIKYVDQLNWFWVLCVVETGLGVLLAALKMIIISFL